MRRYAYIIAVALAALLCREALTPEEAAEKATFALKSILPLKKDFGDEDRVEFINITDEALKEELKALRKEYAYNSFEMFKSASMTAEKDKTVEYRLDDSMNFYCKVTLLKTQTWTDEDGKKRVYFTYKVEVVERPPDGAAEKKVISVEKTRESGKYLLLVFRQFYPASGETPARDFVLAVQASD